MLTWLFFESLPALAVLVATAWFVLLVYWRRTGRVRPLLIGMGVGLLLFVLQAAVTTRRETAAQVLTQLEDAVVRSNLPALEALLAPNFATDAGNGPVLNRAAFLAWVHARMEQIDIVWVNRGPIELVDTAPHDFSVRVSYAAEARMRRESSGTFPSRWFFVFVRGPGDNWLIQQVRAESVAMVRAPHWATLTGW